MKTLSLILRKSLGSLPSRVTQGNKAPGVVTLSAIAAITSILLWHPQGLYAQANAYAGAGGCVDDSCGTGANDEGGLSASVQWNSQTDPLLMLFSQANLTGNASVSADQGQKEVALKVRAAADVVSGTGSSLAFAQWSDHISVTSPLLDPGVHFVDFPVSYEGTLTGISRVEFSVRLTVDGINYSYVFEDHSPASISVQNGFLLFGIPLKDVVDFGVDMNIRIQVEAETQPTSVADFENTFTFGTFAISDANGNPVIGAETVTFTGDSGFIYGAQSVPEPSTVWMLALGAGIFALRRPAHRR